MTALLFFCILFLISVINMDIFFDQYVHSRLNSNSTQEANQHVEKLFSENFLHKQYYINLNALVANFLDHKELNRVIKLPNNYLTESIEKIDPTAYALNTLEFSKYLNELNIPFVYVQAPHKLSTDFELPLGYETFANRNADNLISQLTSIPILDLRHEVVADGLSHYELFYKTDHHFKIEAAFWSTIKITNFISMILDHDPDPFFNDATNYHWDTYSNIFLGSRGARTGECFVGGDDFTIIYPKFDTSLTIEIPTKKINKTGPFDETLMHTQANIALDKEYQTNIYEIYLGWDVDYLKITNHFATNNKKIFLVRDSFARPVGPFLSLHYNEVHMVDLRKNTPSNLVEQINTAQPDLVILMFSPQAFEDKMFNFLP
ncbi:hypothetical protein AN643_02890 [Candidatus Epulonipiscioides saccharophilum]|nr:hypothetical protein AN643_02890 [Epulopiscium sp. SCG-B10WGA-EpuloB]